jgi:hypothetical protein
MSTDNGIPVMNKPVNMMEVGPNGNNLAASAMRRHPVEELQQRQGTYGSSCLLIACCLLMKICLKGR